MRPFLVFVLFLFLISGGLPVEAVDLPRRDGVDSESYPGLDTIYASPVAAGGHIYLTSRNGTTVVIKDSNNLQIEAINSVGETVDATPAPVDNQLFIRGEQHLFCIAE